MMKSQLLSPLILVLLASVSCFGQLPGDFNMDGVYDCSDVDGLATAITGGSSELQFDLTDDGQVLRSDLTRWLEIAGIANVGNPYLYGDVNLDGRVDNSDYTGIWNGNKLTFQSQWCRADVNADGRVDMSDGMVMLNNIYQNSGDVAGTGDGPELISSDMTRFVYDPTDGNMFIAIESNISGWVIPGPEPIEILEFESGFDGGNQMVWNVAYFNNSEQWFGTRVGPPENSGVRGTHLLASYPLGLTEADFGVVEYGAERLANDLPGVLSTEVEIMNVLPGDGNLDGVVDVADFNIWNAHKFGDFEANWGQGDFNGDGRVDVSDFNIWNGNKFQASDAAASVPEPEGVWGLLASMVVLLGCKRSRGR